MVRPITERGGEEAAASSAPSCLHESVKVRKEPMSPAPHPASPSQCLSIYLHCTLLSSRKKAGNKKTVPEKPKGNREQTKDILYHPYSTCSGLPYLKNKINRAI